MKDSVLLLRIKISWHFLQGCPWKKGIKTQCFSEGGGHLVQRQSPSRVRVRSCNAPGQVDYGLADDAVPQHCIGHFLGALFGHVCLVVWIWGFAVSILHPLFRHLLVEVMWYVDTNKVFHYPVMITVGGRHSARVSDQVWPDWNLCVA